ncbi:MAG: hypothetical protein ABW360_18830 [Phenylobacterium sp.]
MARINGTDGADDRHGTDGADQFYMADGNDVAAGWAGNDLMFGGGGRDTLSGGAGNDTLDGGAGQDELRGGAGADVLRAGEGDGSAMWGGAGSDRFDFDSVNMMMQPGQSKAPDQINDFSDGDRIDLRDIDANWNRAGDQAFHLVSGGEFTGQAGELILHAYQIYGAWFVDVMGDVDGDRQFDLMINLQGYHALTASDFLL